MEPNLSFLASRPVAPAANEPGATPAASAAGSAPLEKSDFAQVLNGQTLKAQRQHLAALEAPGQGLQVVPLGNKINVITSDAPLPDLDSLAQFARMQGLNENAVQALFGTTPVAKVTPLTEDAPAADATTAPVTTPDLWNGVAVGVTPPVAVFMPLPALAQVPATPPVAPLTPPGTGDLPAAEVRPAIATVPVVALPLPVTAEAPVPLLADATVPQENIPTLLTSPAAQALQVRVEALSVAPNLPAATVQTSAAAGNSVPLATPDTAAIATAVPPLPTTLRSMPGPVAPALPSAPALAAWTAASAPVLPADTVPVPAATALAASAAQTSLLPMQPQAWLGKTGVAPVEGVDAAPAMAPQDAVRLTLAMPAPEITKRLAQMSGTGKEMTWAALLASGPAAKALPAATDTLTLDLPAGFDADLLAPTSDAGLTQPSDLSTQAGAATVTGTSVNPSDGSAGSNPGNAQAQADHRAQQFQQLADQMGQAAAQRLIAQIERGQWKMQLRMQPAALGNINVELDMHAGGLDALFSSDNAVTRDLMTQGSNKLRDTLTQSGMTVASVSVNGEQSRQSGGNSTPGKGRDAPFANPGASAMASAAVTPAPAAAATESDGLNLLA